MVLKIKSNQIESFQWKEENYVEIMGPQIEYYLYLKGMDIIKDKANMKLIIASNIILEIDYLPFIRQKYLKR